ncbi:MAG: hypothetical protein R3E08_07755 [Thiotrichaceae bacterium]
MSFRFRDSTLKYNSLQRQMLDINSKIESGDCATDTVILNTNKTCTVNFESTTTPEVPPVTPPITPPVQPPVIPPVTPPVTPPPVTPSVQPPVTPPEHLQSRRRDRSGESQSYTLSGCNQWSRTGKVSGNGISCGDSGHWQCNQSFKSHTQVTLSAQPTTGSIFPSWSGSCEGKSAIVTVNMIEHKQCVARFELLATQPEKEDDVWVITARVMVIPTFLAMHVARSSAISTGKLKLIQPVISQMASSPSHSPTRVGL